MMAILAYTALLPAGMVCFVWPQPISRTAINFLSKLLRPLAPWVNESFKTFAASKTLSTRLRYVIAALFLLPLIQLLAMLHPLQLRLLGVLLTLFSVYHLWQLVHLAHLA